MQTQTVPDKARSLLVDDRSSAVGILQARKIFIAFSCFAVSAAVVGFVAHHLMSKQESVRLRHRAQCSKEVLVQSPVRPVWIEANGHVDEHAPGKAIDGNVTSKWHAATSSGWLSFALAPGQDAALTRVEFNMSEEEWSARWPGHITVYGFNATFPLIYGSDGEASWTELWSSSPQWNGTTGISARPNTSTALTPFNAFKIKMENRYPDGNHGGNNWMSNRLTVHEMVLIGSLPKRITYPCAVL
jgi:hypothetical protein